MKLLGKEIWDQHVKELRLTPSNAAAGGKYNGQDLKVFLRPENLEKLAPKIPDDEDRVPENEDEVRETRSEIIINYMTCIDKLHTMCVAKSFVPYDVRGILSEFKEYFTKAYKLGLGLSATTKIHICWTHIPEWFEMQTGLETLYTADCSNFESCHGAIKRIEQSRNLEVKTNRGSDRERRALESSLAHHNFGTDIIPDRDQEAEENTVEVAEELEVNTLALTADSETANYEVSGAVDAVLDANDNVVMPSNHNYGSMVPLTHDKRSKASLIKVIVS